MAEPVAQHGRPACVGCAQRNEPPVSSYPLGGNRRTRLRSARIGFLDTTPPDLRSPNRMAFYEELRKRGYVEGQNLVVEGRNAAGQTDRLPALARELVTLRPDLIVASGPQASRTVKDATSTIPIVMVAVADPIRAGLAASPARPGGNLTGVTTVVPGGIMAKQLDLLHQVVPKATRIAMLVNPANTTPNLSLNAGVLRAWLRHRTGYGP